jgi:CheY-like chemotaxis protein
MDRSVLLIEDDADVRALAELVLRMNGIDVVSCGEGGLGLAALERNHFGLVILDVMMPDMSGYEVLNRILERFGRDAPPVALFTALPEDAAAQRLARDNVAHLLPKPFDPTKFAQVVKELMR